MVRLFQPTESNLINKILELDLRAAESIIDQEHDSHKTFKKIMNEELPYIYVCDDSDLLMGMNSFTKLSKGLISQHWLLADALKQIDEMKIESRMKRQEMREHLNEELGFNARDSTASHYKADRKYQELVPRYKKLAIPYLENSGRSIDDLKPEAYDYDDPRDPRFFLNIIFEFIDEALIDMEQEVILRAFTSLRRLFIKGLRDITEEWKGNEKLKWKEEDRPEGAAEYVHLLSQLEKNCQGHGIGDFTKKLKEDREERALFRLNRLRNLAEHNKANDNSDCFDPDLYSEEHLLECFSEVKALFETLEQFDKSLHHIRTD